MAELIAVGETARAHFVRLSLDRDERSPTSEARHIQLEGGHAATMPVRGVLVTCEAVIAESCYLLRGLPGAGATVLENVESGVFQIPFQLSESAAPVRSLLRKYRDRPADLADACLIHLADQLNTGEILTLDSDFQT